MESLIGVQLVQRELLLTFIRNYKKDGQDRRTEGYYQKRLVNFEKLWDEFVNLHKEILVKKYSAKEQSEKDHDYFENDVFAEMEEFFYTNYALIEERFKKEFPVKTAESSSVNTGQTTSSKVRECGIKLPKISLEKFSGDYQKWTTFHDLFSTMVHKNDSLAPVQKLQYLKLHLNGEPEHLLRHFQVTDKNYEAAWTLLKERYDNKRVLVNTQLKALLFQNNVSNETAQGVRGLLDTTTECLQALENLGIAVENWDPIIVFLIVQKLPHDTHQIWEQEVSKTKELPSWRELKEFLEARFRTLEALSTKKSCDKGSKVQFPKPKAHPQSYHVAARLACSLCFGQHTIRQCEKFIALNPIKRLETVKTKGLCINCLGSGHISSNCPSQKRCYQCNGRNHSLLHKNVGTENNHGKFGGTNPRNNSLNMSAGVGNLRQPSLSSSNSDVVNASANHILSAESPTFEPAASYSSSTSVGSFVTNKSPRDAVLLATATVRVVSSSGQERVVRALIDQGSQASFLTESIVQHLKLRKEAVNASVQGIGNGQLNNVNARVNFVVKPLQGNTEIEVTGLVMNKLTHLLPTTTIHHRTWEHIEGLDLADPHFHKPGKIDLLLGADVFSAIIMSGLIKGKVGTPIAQKTIFGWILSGEIEHAQKSVISVNNFHVRAGLDDQLKAFWELEELAPDNLYTDEEKRCEQIFETTTTRLATGQYEVELPLKEESKDSYLGRSRHVAVRRLHQLEARFQRNPSLKEEYVNCIKEYLSLGHMIQVSDDEDLQGKKLKDVTAYSCSYLPHHAVIKESSTTTKLRVVFDASRPTQSGTSVNDRLLKGPVVQDELASILLRWRKHKVAFTADIEKMYRQIRVKAPFTEMQRIVWRESAEHPIKDYKLLPPLVLKVYPTLLHAC